MTTDTATQPAAFAWAALTHETHPWPVFLALEYLMDTPHDMSREEAVKALHEAAANTLEEVPNDRWQENHKCILKRIRDVEIDRCSFHTTVDVDECMYRIRNLAERNDALDLYAAWRPWIVRADTCITLLRSITALVSNTEAATA